MLQDWQCPHDKLWRVPLVPNVWNLNMDTILLDHPLGHSSLHTMYEVANTTLTCQNIDAISSLAHRREYIHNVYKLPSLEPTVCSLHAAAGFLPKSTWLKAVQQGNYSTWPLINVKNVAKYFCELEETRIGHMQGQRPERPIHSSHQCPRCHQQQKSPQYNSASQQPRANCIHCCT